MRQRPDLSARLDEMLAGIKAASETARSIEAEAATCTDAENKGVNWMTWPVLEPLTDGQRRVLAAFFAGGPSCTYTSVAEGLGLHEGTIRTHVGRVRSQHPGVYAEFQRVRTMQRALRHRQAEMNRRKHSDKWFRKQRRRAAVQAELDKVAGSVFATILNRGQQ